MATAAKEQKSGKAAAARRTDALWSSVKVDSEEHVGRRFELAFQFYDSARAIESFCVSVKEFQSLFEEFQVCLQSALTN